MLNYFRIFKVRDLRKIDGKVIWNQAGIANRGGRGVVPPPTPLPRNGPKNQLTFLFKAFFSFFFANHILHAVKCIKMNFFST